MTGNDDRRSPSGLGDERSGAFVARVWHDERGLRARIRHTADLADPEEIAIVTGYADQVVPDLVGRFRRWIEGFAVRAGRAGSSEPGLGARAQGESASPADPNDEPMTPH